MAHKSIDFGLSDEILAIIPTDPYDQLDLARKITSMAIASRVSTLESEIMKLKQNDAEKDKRIVDLQEQIKDLDKMFEDSERRLREATDENGKLMKERDTLALTAKKLGKELSKLEAFKRQLMMSLSDDRSSLAESVNIPSGYRPIARTSSWGEETSINNKGSDSTEIENQSLDASGSEGTNKLSVTPYLTPRHTPTATPTAASTVASPRGFSTAGSSPRLWSGLASPTKSCFEGLSSASSAFTSSNTPTQQSSASSSPPSVVSSGRVPRIDGKEFFRQARSRLTLEQFGAFLANIKELNAHKQSREETLKKAEEIFGTDNKDLYISFQRMLIRNLP